MQRQPRSQGHQAVDQARHQCGGPRGPGQTGEHPSLLPAAQLPPQHPQQRQHLQRGGSGVGQGQTADGQGLDQEQAQEHVQSHGGHADEHRGFGVFQGVETAGRNLHQRVPHQAQGKKAQRVRGHLRIAGVERPPLQQQRHDGLTQEDKDDCRRQREENEQGKKPAQGVLHGPLLPQRRLMRESGKSRGGDGLGEDALGQQHD